VFSGSAVVFVEGEPSPRPIRNRPTRLDIPTRIAYSRSNSCLFRNRVMGKTYLIIHDDAHVLVCRGGTSGSQVGQRRGTHLPGGTNESNSVLEDAKRELKEETGFGWDDLGVTETITIEPARLLRYGVKFLKVKVSDVETLASQFQPPGGGKPQDSPFTAVEALAIENCWAAQNGFQEHYGTDWFGLGLQAAFQTRS